MTDRNHHHEAPSEDAALERAISAALERKPAPAIPADFAVRVAMQAAAMPLKARAPRAQYGRKVALSAAGVLTVALFALAPHVTPAFSDPGFLTELAVLAQLGGIGAWMLRMQREPS